MIIPLPETTSIAGFTFGNFYKFQPRFTMKNFIEINNQTYIIGYYPATIIHSDKYSERSPFASSSYCNYTPKHDIAFRTTRTGEECFFTVSYSRIRAMIGQEVSLIVLDKYVIGYINNSNNDYYYLTKEFAQTLKLGIHWRWIVLVEILLALGLFFNSAYAQSYIAYSIFAIPILYVAGMRFFNFYIEKKIDEVVLNG